MYQVSRRILLGNYGSAGPRTHILSLTTFSWILLGAAGLKRRNFKGHAGKARRRCCLEATFRDGEEATVLNEGTWKYASVLRRNRIGHTSLDEIAVPLQRTGLRHIDMLERTNYQTAGCIHS